MITLEVVTVCFNDLTNLKLTSASLIEQRNKNFTWKVIDGGSTDGTVQFLNEFNPDYNFEFVSERDAGIYDAMNRATLSSSAEYIWFLNAGDLCFDQNSTDNILKNLTSNSLNFFEVVYPREDKEHTSVVNFSPREAYFNMPVCHQGIIYRRGVFTEVGLFDLDYQLSADYEHLRKVLKAGKTYSSHYLKICRYKGGGLSEKRLGILYYEIFKISLNYNPFPIKLFSFPMYLYRYFKHVRK